MDNDSGAQRQEYGNKTGEVGHDKALSKKPLDMIKAGGSGDGSGPTGSSRSYPKGGKVAMRTDFNPQKEKATEWAVGGAG